MPDQFDTMLAAFAEEASELLERTERAALGLESDPDDRSLVDDLFRAVHTLKGSGSMFGLDGIVSLAHELESAYATVRDENRSADRPLIELTLEVVDRLRSMLASGSSVHTAADDADEFAARLRSAAHASTGDQTMRTVTHFTIRFAPSEDLLRSGLDPLGVLQELTELGKCDVTSRLALAPLNELDPTGCCVAWEITLATEAALEQVQDVFMFIDDESVVEITQDDGACSPDRPRHASGGDTGTRLCTESVRVSAAKLDELVDLVGEMVTAQAHLTQAAQDAGHPPVIEIAEEIERLTATLRESVFSVRMMPIGTLEARLRRLVHDLQGQLGKPIDFCFVGEDTELDKNVIESLHEPLVHLIRNCADHGLETQAEREAAGKPGTGTITVSARHAGDKVVIEVVDDGRGIDVDAIWRRARERGLVESAEPHDEAAALELIFAPGFSTSGVSQVSGCGVGLDVVRTSIKRLRGCVDVTTNDAGTSFRIELPLTLAIIDGLLVRVGSERYVVPLDAVLECVEIAHSANDARRLVMIRGAAIPYVRLVEFFDDEDQGLPHELVIVASTAQGITGFAVDEVCGQRQAVIKPLGRLHRNAVGVSGATVLGDGDVALILDLEQIARISQAASVSDHKARTA